MYITFSDLKKLNEIQCICAKNVSIGNVKIAVAFLNVRVHLRNIPYKDDFAIATINNSKQYISTLVTPTNNWIPNFSKYSSSFVNDYENSTIIKNDPDKKPKNNIPKPCTFKYRPSSEVENIFNNTIIKKDPDEEPKANTLDTWVFEQKTNFKKGIVIKKDPDGEPKANSSNTSAFTYRPNSQVKNNFTEYSHVNEKCTVIKKEPDEEPKENTIDTCIFEYRPSSEVKNILQNRTPQKFQVLKDINNDFDCMKLKAVPLIELLDIKISSPSLLQRDTADISDKSNIENGECINTFMRVNKNNNEFDIMSEEKCNKGDLMFNNLEEIKPNVHSITSKDTIICEWDNDSMFSNNSFDEIDQVVIQALSQGSIHAMNHQPEKTLESQLIAGEIVKTQKQGSLKRILPEWMIGNNNTVFTSNIKKKKTVYID